MVSLHLRIRLLFSGKKSEKGLFMPCKNPIVPYLSFYSSGFRLAVLSSPKI
jgi:hypothetical protein